MKGCNLNHRFAARLLLSLLNLAQGIATVVIDLDRTHATNPNWPGHARFHLVWQVVSSALLCALAVGLIWLRGPTTEYNFYLAAILTCIPLIGFMTAFVSRKMYSGALSDPNGIQPVPLAIRGLILYLDMNLVAVLAAFAVLTAILVTYW
jgi:hypothetical protein